MNGTVYRELFLAAAVLPFDVPFAGRIFNVRTRMRSPLPWTPFPASVMGSLTFFLALLMTSSKKPTHKRASSP